MLPVATGLNRLRRFSNQLPKLRELPLRIFSVSRSYIFVGNVMVEEVNQPHTLRTDLSHSNQLIRYRRAGNRPGSKLLGHPEHSGIPGHHGRPSHMLRGSSGI